MDNQISDQPLQPAAPLQPGTSSQVQQIEPVTQPSPQPPETQQIISEPESKIASCNKCSKQFKIIKQEVKFLQEKNLPFPTMCPSCREERRQSLRNPRQLIKAKCNKCQKEIITTPKANPNVKVYCDACFKNYLNTVDPIIK